MSELKHLGGSVGGFYCNFMKDDSNAMVFAWVEKNFQEKGRMRGEWSLLGWETLS